MFKTRKHWLAAGVLAACSTVWVVSCATSWVLGKDDFRVVRNTLQKGDDDFTLYAIHARGLGEAGDDLTVMAPAMARVAEVGGNTLAFDLGGFNAGGSEIAPIGIETVRAFAERAKGQRMTILVRVLGNSTDREFRERAVKTAAKKLKEGRAVYWIDGPNAGELAAQFKKRNKSLVVAAPENGDIRVVTAPPVEPPETPTMVLGALPHFEEADTHFVLWGDEGAYARLDAALTRPEEKEDWAFDPAMLSEAEQQDGFVPLFNGENLDGWWMKGDNANAFHVSEEGYIEWLESGGGALMTAKRYGDFVLRFEWKILPEGNSGVWLRAPRGARQSRIGMEFQLRGDSGAEEPDESNTGAVYDVIPPMAMPAHPEGQWNTAQVHFEGPLYRAWINGVLVQDVNFDEDEELTHRLRKGFICLTDHGNYVAYRNIRIKEL